MRMSVASLPLAVLTVAGMFAMTGTVGAANLDDEPNPLDARAVAIPVKPGADVTGADCATLFPGSTEAVVVNTSTSDATLTVAAVAGARDLAGVIVKGRESYNKYSATKLGSLAWAAPLHSPEAGHSGAPATITHWFACAY